MDNDNNIKHRQYMDRLIAADLAAQKARAEVCSVLSDLPADLLETNDINVWTEADERWRSFAHWHAAKK